MGIQVGLAGQAVMERNEESVVNRELLARLVARPLHKPFAVARVLIKTLAEISQSGVPLTEPTDLEVKCSSNFTVPRSRLLRFQCICWLVVCFLVMTDYRKHSDP